MTTQELIKYKKGKYGDSFKSLSLEWGAYLGKELKPKEVAHLMYLLKINRYNNLRMKMALETDIKELEKFAKAIVDTQKDMDAYKWISDNFGIYETL